MRWRRLLSSGVALFLLAAAIWPWLPEEPVDLERNTLPAAAPEPLATITFRPLRSAYPETLARPLFGSTRRPAPVEPESVAPPAAPPRLVGYRLTGIVSTGARRMILLETPDGTSVRLHEGESVDGWTVETIDETAVIVSLGQTRVDLLNDGPEPVSGGAAGRNTRWLPAGGSAQ